MKKNYDPELQIGRMFLTHQMAVIPTFMPPGRLKTNICISSPLILIYKKMRKMNRQWAVYINTWCERFDTHIQILLLCAKSSPPTLPQKHRGKQWYMLLIPNFGSSELHAPVTLSLEKKPPVSTEWETRWTSLSFPSVFYIRQISLAHHASYQKGVYYARLMTFNTLPISTVELVTRSIYICSENVLNWQILLLHLWIFTYWHTMKVENDSIRKTRSIFIFSCF